MPITKNIIQHIIAFAEGEQLELGYIVDTLYVQLYEIANIQDTLLVSCK
jgi:hypothetical protein